MRELLEDISRDRAIKGYSPSETAIVVFSLKEPLFELLRQEIASDAGLLAKETWVASSLIDRLGLYTIECYARIREDVITRQQQELLELSTPVVELWDGILALPLIGTLDSARTQIVMESLLQRIVTSGGDRHRHHRRADRRYAGRAPDQDDLGRTADGRRLHPERTDRRSRRQRPPGPNRTSCPGHHGRCARPAPPRSGPGGHDTANSPYAVRIADGRNPHPGDRRLPAGLDPGRHARSSGDGPAGRPDRAHRRRPRARRDDDISALEIVDLHRPHAEQHRRDVARVPDASTVVVGMRPAWRSRWSSLASAHRCARRRTTRASR
jgi:hypothetical protein